ncbi:hypothetical protein [Streptomyces sp. NPDC013455]|uniref:allene oxide cyclase barrel-like domain-containing protein n=1 Tax=Streptomyces sp. NPDC013455 TaxID=3155605 RepID=UPI0033E634C2
MSFLKATGIGSTVALATLTTLLTCTTPAGAAEPTPARSEAELTLVAKTTGHTIVDIADDGTIDAGDYVVFTDDLYDEDDNRVGNAGTICTLISEDHNGEAQCTFTFRSEHGDITATSLSHGIMSNRPKNFDAAITGGTGSYSGVAGDIHGHAENASEVTLEFHIKF